MAPKEDETFKFDAQEFMIDKFNEDGTQPKILGSGFQGDDSIFVIETPNGGTMMIKQDKYTENFGERKAKGGRIGYKDGTLEPINIGIGTFNPERAKELYENVKSIPGKISSISLEDIKETGSGLGEGISSFYEAAKNPIDNSLKALSISNE